MSALATRWARIGPTDRRWLLHVPKGGLCLSAFVIVRNRRGDVLLGRPAFDRSWLESGGLPLWRVRELVREGVWVLPATHFMMYESPDRAATRIARRWTGGATGRPRFVAVDSYAAPSPYRRSGRARGTTDLHWDFCFLYEMRSDRAPRRGRAWTELKFVPRTEISKLKIGRGQRDIVLRMIHR